MYSVISNHLAAGAVEMVCYCFTAVVACMGYLLALKA